MHQFLNFRKIATILHWSLCITALIMWNIYSPFLVILGIVCYLIGLNCENFSFPRKTFQFITLEDIKYKNNRLIDGKSIRESTRIIHRQLKAIELYSSLTLLTKGHYNLILIFTNHLPHALRITRNHDEIPSIHLVSFWGGLEYGDIKYDMLSPSQNSCNICKTEITIPPHSEKIIEYKISSKQELQKAKSLILAFHESSIEIGDYACHVTELQWHCKIEDKQALDYRN